MLTRFVFPNHFLHAEMASKRSSRPKVFEKVVTKELEDVRGVQILSQGLCYKCNKNKGSCRCRSKYCPDIVGIYRKRKINIKFVADCKLYDDDTYLDEENCDKIIRDRDQAKASVGMLFVSRGKVSVKMRKKLAKSNIHLIEVKYGTRNWKEKLVGGFKECF